MKKTNTLKKVTVTALVCAFAFSTASCELITTNSKKDMKQVVAEVNISTHSDFKAGGKYAAYKDPIAKMNSDILKRDLIAYFINVGYYYVNYYGYTYAQTFEMIINSLVNSKITAQYAMAYFFDREAGADEYDYSPEAYQTYYNAQLAAAKDTPLANHTEIISMMYFLTEGGTDTEYYDRAVYTLQHSINQSIDSTEKTYIKETSSSSSETPRTTPTNVGAQKDDYYVKVDNNGYGIYNGNNLGECGAYEALPGSTAATRKKAYNQFLSNLSSNYLLADGEDTSEFTNIDYYYVELSSQLEQALITKYTDDLGKTANGRELDEKYVQGRYESLLASQKNSYDTDTSAFESAAGSISDSSFVLYTPENANKAGFVYNILLPFSAKQSAEISAYGKKAVSQAEKYAYRAKVLANVTAEDLRDSWFSADEDSNYAYEADGKYYFFEDNMKDTEDQYKKLSVYNGNYAYNGSVTVDKDGKYTCVPDILPDIDAFLAEMENYYAAEGMTASSSKYANYVTDAAGYTLDENDNFDFSQFMYATGKVEVGTVDEANYFVAENNDAYKAASIFNELMFAYSTDTGCLNTYKGYFVSAVDTNFVDEFEYASQWAVNQGVGTYVVCPSTYGWHIIYVTSVFDAGNVYGSDWNALWAQKDVEGSFMNLFYEALKSDTTASLLQSQVLSKYNNSSSVTIYEGRYEDLTNLDKR